MSLTNMQVFNQYANLAMTETLDKQIGLFNAATKGAIILRSASSEGDFSEEAKWKKISGLVRRRDAYATATLSAVDLAQLLERSVKVGAGTFPVNMDPSDFTWVQKSPDEAGAVFGANLAEDSMADMLQAALASYVSAMATQAANFTDGTGGVNSLSQLNTAASKFGDQASRIACWVMHSKSLFNIYGEALTNTAKLFEFGNIKVMEDGFGRPLIVSDIAALQAGAVYKTAGLVSGGIIVDQNNDFYSNISETNGNNNISRTMQAEWTFNLGHKGMAWDSANGGKSPTDAELITATNWDKVATSHKDLGGVLLHTD